MIKFSFFFIFIFSFSNCISQVLNFSIPDSLQNKSYWELQNKIYSCLEKDSINKAKIYTNSFLAKAFTERDSLYISEGYLFLSATVATDKELQNKYLDISINYAKNLNDWLVPCMAYSIKGGLFDDKNEYEKSLNYYLLAHESAEKGGNTALVYQMKENIGITKSRIGDYKGALKYSRETWNHLKNKEVDDSYLNSIFSMSYLHSHLKNIDSSKYYNQLGLMKARGISNNYHINRFIFLSGISNFYEANYDECIINIEKSLKKFKEKQDVSSIAASYYYLGNSFDKLNREEIAENYFIKMDSIFNNTKLLIPYCRNGYKVLIGYYKKSGNTKQQLFYTNRLLKLDSIININYKSLSETIYEKFETLELVKDRDLLIDNLKKKDIINLNYISGLLFFVIAISIGLIYNYYKRKKDYLKFQLIINQSNAKDDDSKQRSDNMLKDNIDLDEDLINSILIKLKSFEDKKEFLNPNISLTFLSKKIKTNSRYLSKVINYSNKKTFIHYVNDLRIEYVINRLKEDISFRKYTVEAIGKEAGFKTSRAFSEGFKKKTGLYPSYFISKLNNDSIY